MNDIDRSNVVYILNLTPEQFKDWYNQLDAEDIIYASEILRGATTEILMEMLEASDKVEDTTKASQFLRKFSLKGN
jgi:uncharacterized HAD superfamily protein